MNFKVIQSAISKRFFKEKEKVKMFEKATRLKLRFTTPQGPLSVEDLWDLPLTSTSAQRANLNAIAKVISRALKAEAEEDFVNPQPKADDTLQLSLDIVKRIIQVRQAENETAANAASRKEQKARLLELIAHKKDRALEEKSVEELTAMVEAL